MNQSFDPRRPLGRLFYCLLALLLAAGLARAQAPVTVSGNVQDMTGAPASKTKVRLHLSNCNGVPRVLGSTIIAREHYEFTPDSAGDFSGSLYPNTVIDCDGATTSTYKVLIHVDGKLRWQSEFLIAGTTDLNSAVPLATAPAPPVKSYVETSASGVQTVTGALDIKVVNGVRHAHLYPSLQAAVDDTPAGGTLVIPANIEFYLTTPVVISKNLSILGMADRPVSSMVLSGNSAPVIIAPGGGPIFQFSGSIYQFRLEGLNLQGDGPGTSVFDTTGMPFTEGGNWTIQNNVIKGFGSYALTLGQSVAFYHVRHNWFQNNAGSIDIAWAADGVIEDNYFFRPEPNPQIRVVGGSLVNISKNIFVKASGSSMDPDVEINAASVNTPGYVWIDSNKFGPEGEAATRVKVRAYNAAAANRSQNVYVINNFFGGGAAGTDYAIQLDNPVDRWLIAGNFFSSYRAALINDNFTLVDAAYGQSVFRNNRVLPVGGAMPTATARDFANGGRGFAVIEPAAPGVQLAADYLPRNNETLELRNRLSDSENFASANWTKEGITLTAAQTDPFGSSRAYQLTRAGAVAEERMYAGMNCTGMHEHFVVKLWMKAGTLTTAQLALRNVTRNRYEGQIPMVTLDSEWRQYKVHYHGLTPGDAHRLYIWPGSRHVVAAGTIFVFGVQVSDLDSDYYPTAGSAASTTAYGNRFERGLLAPAFASSTANAASTGAVRLASGDVINFRNAANNANVTALAKDGSDVFTLGSGAGVRITGPLASTVATGTAPLAVASTTLNANLNADLLDGYDWSAPPALGSVTPAAGTFTGLTAATAVIGENTGKSTAASLTGQPLQLVMANVLTDATAKQARTGMLAYTNSQLPLGFFAGDTGSSSNVLRIGGGADTLQAATLVQIYTANSVNTATGTIRWQVDSAGHLLAGSDGVYDIGGAASMRPRNVFIAGKVTTAKAMIAGLATVTFSATPTFDATLGNTFKLTLTGNVTNSTLSGATAGQTLNFILCQDSTGGRTFVWPANVKGGMAIGAAASGCSAQTFIFDGSNAFALSSGVINQ